MLRNKIELATGTGSVNDALLVKIDGGVAVKLGMLEEMLVELGVLAIIAKTEDDMLEAVVESSDVLRSERLLEATGGDSRGEIVEIDASARLEDKIAGLGLLSGLCDMLKDGIGLGGVGPCLAVNGKP